MILQFKIFLQKWFTTESGSKVFTQEKQLLQGSLCNLFGFNLVQLGAVYPSPDAILDESRIPIKIVLDENKVLYKYLLHVRADLDYLPLKKESIDVIFLPHAFESVEDPYHLLRQVDDIIVAEGHIMITGFNRKGFDVLRNKLGKKRHGFKQANLIPMERIIDWLTLLGYDIQEAKYSTVFRTKLNSLNKKTFYYRFTFWVEKMLDKAGINFGNVYIIVALKRVESIRPVGFNWQLANWLPFKGGVIKKGVKASASLKDDVNLQRNKL